MIYSVVTFKTRYQAWPTVFFNVHNTMFGAVNPVILSAVSQPGCIIRPPFAHISSSVAQLEVHPIIDAEQVLFPIIDNWISSLKVLVQTHRHDWKIVDWYAKHRLKQAELSAHQWYAIWLRAFFGPKTLRWRADADCSQLYMLTGRGGGGGGI